MFKLDLKDKVILITGGSDGLGFASARLLDVKPLSNSDSRVSFIPEYTESAAEESA